jgi:hypothetical protein
VNQRLTPKQEGFVQALVSGASQRAAYKAAYSTKTMLDKTVDEKASRLFGQDKIRARYDELIDELAKRVLWDRENAARELLRLLEVSGKKVDLSVEAVYERVMTTDRRGGFVEATAKTVPVDVPKNATRAVVSAVKELNKMFRVYDDDDGKGQGTVIIDDF